MTNDSTANTLDERRELCGMAGITLDGQPAKIMGAQLPFAHVRFISNGMGVEFAWPTVARIVANGGKFKS